MALETVPLHLAILLDFERLKMKSNAWKKDYIVIRHNDYDDTWTDRTIPCTFLQAVKFISSNNWNHYEVKGSVRIVTLAEFETIKTLAKA
jgi:hypothetical protein